MYAWNDQLRTGHEEIDEQHRMLFKICDRIEKNFDDGDQAKKRNTAIEGAKYLKMYTLRHFETEERLQQSLNFVDYEKHKMVHEQFKKMLGVYEKELVEHNYDDETVNKLLGIVKKWLVDHIMGMDQKIPKE